MKRSPSNQHIGPQRVGRANICRAQQSGRRKARQRAEEMSAAAAPVGAPAAADTAIFTKRAQRWFALAVLGVALAGVFIVVLQNLPGWLSANASAQAAAQATADAIVVEQTGVAVAATAAARRIGIVSGHRGHDSGAVCDDGLTEAEVNFVHATRVAELLRAQGYTVDVLDEFDARLRGYRARVLLSIHADSCARINELATGFKVARAVHSRSPEAEDRLIACLTAHYKARTGLRFHANTITRDMTEYHAFDEVAPETPAAIIETGFMYLDRPLLTRRPEVVAQGIADGLLCFLRDDAP